jgi:hypothetical protein
VAKTKEELLENEVQKLMSKPTERVVKRISKKGVKCEIKPEWVLLSEGGNTENVNKLMRVYKDNPKHAYVLYYNNVGTFHESRSLLFKYSEKHFEVVRFQKTFGMSKTNRIYSRNKKLFSLIYKENKFWFYEVGNKNNKIIKPLTIKKLKELICNVSGKNAYSVARSEFISKLNDTELYKFFDTNFFWFKTLMEYGFADNLTINTIISKKLFGFDKLNRYIFKMNKAATTRLINSNVLYQGKNIGYFDKEDNFVKETVNKDHLSNVFFQWKKIVMWFEDIEHFDFSVIKQDETLFWDTLNMAEKLNKKISGRWGFKKLTAMHDLWSIEIQNILLDCEVERDLKIVKIFKDFAKFSGYELMKTNKDLLREGMRQNHCVGTYIDRVDNGECAIFNVNGYTLQLVVLEFDEIKHHDDSLYFKETLNINNDKKIISCRTAVIKGLEGYRNNMRSNYNFTYKPEYDDLIKNGMWLHNNQFKGRFNVNAPKELQIDVEKKLREFSSKYNFKRIYKESKKKTNFDTSVFKTLKGDILPF